MINIKHLTKSYKNVKVLNDISLSLARNGLIAICGDSGCGKTTLLNCLSCLIDYEGEIIIDGVNLFILKEEKKDNFRLKNIGFIFQDFKLFNTETVERNILLPLDMSSDMKNKYKERKVNDLLDLVGLSKFKKYKVNLLSGGEKQRVTIARALVNDPKIILADEPTGALDSKNSEDIMSILDKISKTALVIVVSHDEELMRKYASTIIHMKDGTISSFEYPNKEDRDIYLPLFKNKKSTKKPSIPSNFLFHHCFSSIREKKWRTLICTLITSLGLIGVGLASSLTTSISSNIKNAYSSMIDDSKIIMFNNDHPSYQIKSGGSYVEAIEIAKKFPQYVNDVGVTYLVDFEKFFKTSNEFAIASTTYRQILEGFSTRNINEFKWLDLENPSEIYPHKFENLDDDEVIFGLNMPMIQDICLKLRIERSVESLSNYLAHHDLLIYLDTANEEWSYHDQQLFNLRGFVLEPDLCIYHTNHLWNEYIFEERMRIPSNDNLTEIDYYPWVMKKMCYFYAYNSTDDFLIESESSPYLDDYLLEIADEKIYPWLYKNVDLKNRNRVLLYLNTIKSIPKRYADILINENQGINEPIYGSDGGYCFYPSNMLFGFSHQTYFSFSESQLISVVDENSTLNLSKNEYIVLEDGVMVGHYSKTMQESVRFAVINEKMVIGNTPKSLDEIVISTGLAKKLSGITNTINNDLYISYNNQEKLLDNGELKRTFVNTHVRVCGLINSDRLEIYHYPYWTINFFKSRLGVSVFDLSINSIAFTSEKTSNELINNMSRNFPQYEVINPMEDIANSVNQICFYIEIVLSIFSLIATIIASLLLTICTYLHILDSQKEIALSRCLGVSKKESKKFVIYHTVLMCLLSLIVAIFEVIAISIIASIIIAQSLHSSMIFSLDIKGVLFMVVVAFIISLVSSIWVSGKTNKINPLEVLKK